MNAAVQQLLNVFDTLTEADKYQVAVEILRRCPPLGSGELPDEALAELADELFRALDEEETRYTPR